MDKGLQTGYELSMMGIPRVSWCQEYPEQASNESK